MSSKIRVLLVDDHDMFRDGVKLLLSSGSEVEVVAEARNGQEFLDIVEDIKPDVVLMDIAMPVMDGIEASRIVHERFPDLKILALTMFGDEKYYYQLIQYNIKGFILKSSGISELIGAVIQVFNGTNYFSNELLVKLLANINFEKSKISEQIQSEKLSKREVEIMQEISSGLSNEKISEKLNISLATVKTHRANLLLKTGSNNTASLVMYAIKNKLIDAD